MTSIVVAKFGL